MEPKLITTNVNPIGMSYWRNINFHADSKLLQVVLSKNNVLTLYALRKDNLDLVTEFPLNINHTGEGCFFSALDCSRLFIPFDNYLATLDLKSGDQTKVWESNNKLWQMHSSIGETVFSGTIKDDNYKVTGWAVYQNGQEKIYPLKGNPDECQIDKSGKWLLIKESIPIPGTDKENEYNRIINLATDEERIVNNEEGALGHSDNDYECALGENDMSNFPGALDKIDFNTGAHENLYSTGIWNMGYVSVQNGKILLTTPQSLILVNTGEKVCDHLSESDTYEHRPKANLCPLGEYAAFTSFVQGSLNAYVVKVS